MLALIRSYPNSLSWLNIISDSTTESRRGLPLSSLPLPHTPTPGTHSIRHLFCPYSAPSCTDTPLLTSSALTGRAFPSPVDFPGVPGRTAGCRACPVFPAVSSCVYVGSKWNFWVKGHAPFWVLQGCPWPVPHTSAVLDFPHKSCPYLVRKKGHLVPAGVYILLRTGELDHRS